MSEIYFQSDDKSFTLYHGDCLDVLPRLVTTFGDAYADLVFADPPYYLSNDGITCQSGKMVSVNKGKWDKSNGPAEDHAMVKRWLEAARMAMKPDATIWITGTMHIIYNIGFALQELHFKLLNDIVWVKPAPPPNLACRTFTHTTEIVLWAARNDGLVKGEKKSKYVYNYPEMKRQNGGKQMRSFWGEPPADEELLWLPPSERDRGRDIPVAVELDVPAGTPIPPVGADPRGRPAVGAYSIRPINTGLETCPYPEEAHPAVGVVRGQPESIESDSRTAPPQKPNRDRNVAATNENTATNIFELGAPKSKEKKFGKHPTQKPLALLRRIIEAGSHPGQMVVDPFCGSGTTCIMSSLLDRKTIGIDYREEYLSIARDRYLALTNSRGEKWYLGTHPKTV